MICSYNLIVGLIKSIFCKEVIEGVRVLSLIPILMDSSSMCVCVWISQISRLYLILIGPRQYLPQIQTSNLNRLPLILNPQYI